jgi:hypothetical protein
MSFMNLPENWKLLRRGTEAGDPYCQVSLTVGDEFIGIWKLRKFDDWRVTSIFFTDQSLREYPKGIRLTCSRRDSILLSMAQSGEPSDILLSGGIYETT